MYYTIPLHHFMYMWETVHYVFYLSLVGVQALIQQYTVPPGTVPSLSPSKDESLSKVSRSTSSASAQSKREGGILRNECTIFPSKSRYCVHKHVYMYLY